MNFDPSLPPLVPETVLKNKRTLEELSMKRSELLKNQVKRRRVIRGEDVKIKRPEQFVREFRIREGSFKKRQRKEHVNSKKKNSGLKQSDIKPTVGFVIRIHEGRHTSNTVKKELSNMGLKKKYDAKFVKLDFEGIGRLKPLDAYLAYGYISNNSVVELVHRRSHIMNKGRKEALTDNITVEKHLGEDGILCLNDLSHEIFNLGPQFDKCNNLLTTFELSSPLGNFDTKILKLHDAIESQAGFIGDKMEEFLNKIF